MKTGRFTKGAKRFGGRAKGTPNKSTQEVRLLSQQYGEEAIETLVRIMRTDESSDCKISAAKEILNRGYGRVPMAHNIAGHDGGPLDISVINAMSLQQLEALAEKLAAALAADEAARRLQ